MLDLVIDNLQRLTGHKYFKLKKRGNAAIKEALDIARQSGKKKLILPDQGGWITYSQFAKKLKFTVQETMTDYGVMRPDALADMIGTDSCLIYSNPAGYFASQPIKEIYAICKGKCLVIMDVTGCIGDNTLCDGKYADIFVGSFGKWKPVNLGTGGFISADKQELISQQSPDSEIEPALLPQLVSRLETVSQRISVIYHICNQIKNDLADFDVLHRDSKCLNVIIRFYSEQEKTKILKYCKDKNYEYTICPMHIRVMCNAVSIEVKRLIA